VNRYVDTTNPAYQGSSTTHKNYPYLPEPVYCITRLYNLTKVNTSSGNQPGDDDVLLLLWDPSLIKPSHTMIEVLCTQQINGNTADSTTILVNWWTEIINLAADIALDNIESGRTQEHNALTR